MNTAAFSEQEIQDLRAETRGTSERIHFNNAGASLPPDVVVETMVKYLNEEAVYGGYEVEASYEDALENVYALIARLSARVWTRLLLLRTPAWPGDWLLTGSIFIRVMW